jgi:hypothetical protein
MPYLLFIIFIAFVIRFLFLFQPIGYDEAFSFLLFSSKPLSIALSNYLSPNNHLLHTFFVHIFFKLFGPAPAIIRLPAFFAGILIIWANYAWVKRIYDKNSALISSALLAASSILVEYSSNARGYTLMILFSILALSSAHKLISSQLQRGYLWFIISSALGFYIIPTFIYPFSVCIAILSFYIISEFRKSSQINITPLLISLFVVALLTILLYLPIFLNIQKVFNVLPFFFTPDPIFILSKKVTILTIEAARQWVQYIPFTAAICCNVIFLISFINKELRKKHLFLIMPVVAGCLAVLLLVRRAPDTARHLLFLLPIYYALIAGSLAWFINIFIRHINWTGRFNIYGIFALLLALFLSLKVIDNYSKQVRDLQSAQEIVFTLKSELKDTDRVCSVCPADAPLAYYFYLSGMSYQQLSRDPLLAQRLFIIVKRNQDLKSILGIAPTNAPQLISDFTDASLYVINKVEK